jgi:hypothetical protein
VQFFIPSRHYIQNLKPGDKALDSFGHLKPVAEVYGRGDDINGHAYICYYSDWGNGTICSMSQVEGQLTRHAGMSHYYKSFELDKIEKEMLT